MMRFCWLLFCCFIVQYSFSQTLSDLVVLKNNDSVLPITDLANSKFTVLPLSNHSIDEGFYQFNNRLNDYAPVKTSNNTQQIENFDTVICLVSNTDVNWELIYELTTFYQDKKLILVSSLPLQSISFNNYIFDVDAIIQSSLETLENAAELIFGGATTKATLNEDIPGRFTAGSGLKLTNQIRLGFSKLPNPKVVQEVDSIMNSAILQNAFPGAQLLVAYKNDIIFHNTYGFHTYEKRKPVKKNDLYDLASVTKVTAPLPAIMKLVDQGVLDLDKPFSDYWKGWQTKADKKTITLREVLAHQAGLIPYHIFLNEVLEEGHFNKKYIRTDSSKRFPIKAYDDIYVSKRFRKKMYQIINDSKVSNKKKYKYSGISFLLYPKIISDLTGIHYQQYLQDSIYQPLGANTLLFNPVGKYDAKRIIPTELDTIFRKQVVSGYVHDENAALLGGVSGNAGLFGTALDLAKLLKMYQNMGSYGAKQYISEKTLNEFTSVQFPENDNKRGLGFDKPKLTNHQLPLSEASPSPLVSSQSFGHGGFTGTYIWADPKYDLLFIFLSNRVYPTRTNRNLYKLNVFPSLQNVFYKALIK